MRGKGEINSLPHNRNRKQRVIWEVLRQSGYVLFKLIIQHKQPESNTKTQESNTPSPFVLTILDRPPDPLTKYIL